MSHCKRTSDPQRVVSAAHAHVNAGRLPTLSRSECITCARSPTLTPLLPPPPPPLPSTAVAITRRRRPPLRAGPTRFLVRGEDSERVFAVHVGPEAQCSCGRARHCVHVLFVMIKVTLPLKRR
jgi:hypothetical protein